MRSGSARPLRTHQRYNDAMIDDVTSRASSAKQMGGHQSRDIKDAGDVAERGGVARCDKYQVNVRALSRD